MVQNGIARLALILGLMSIMPGCTPPTGAEVAFFATGKRKSEVPQSRNKAGALVRQGLYRSWHPNGKLHEQGMYVNGFMHGQWTIWDEDGRKRGEQHYNMGKRHGRWFSWHANGRRARTWQYHDDKAHGDWLTWDEAGHLVSREIYSQGVLQTQQPGAAAPREQLDPDVDRDLRQVSR